MNLLSLVSINLLIYEFKQLLWGIVEKLLTFLQTLNTDKSTKHLSIFFVSCTHKSLFSNVLLFTWYGLNITPTEIVSFVFMRTFHDQVPYFSASPSHLHNSVSYIYIYYVTFIENILKPERDKIDPVASKLNHSHRV